MRKSIREDKERFIEGLSLEGVGAAAKGDMKQLYDTSKRQVQSRKRNSGDQLKRWAVHFKNSVLIFNRPALPQMQNITAAETDQLTDQAGERLREPLVS